MTLHNYRKLKLQIDTKVVDVYVLKNRAIKCEGETETAEIKNIHPLFYLETLVPFPQ